MASDQLDIAIIAMEGRFPGARNLSEFWDNLVAARESIVPFSDEEYLAAGGDPDALADLDFTKVDAAVEGIEEFDAPFFGYRTTEAELMDPQQRLFLECAYQALEQAGYLTDHGGLTGVFAGATPSRCYHTNVLPRLGRRPSSITQLAASINNSPGSFATRVSYDLNLTGPSMSVQTACSTSLVAVHLACRELADRSCDLALAGGASLNPTPRTGYRSVPDGPFAPDGHCRPFDVKAAGMVPADGVGVVVLKRLADAIADGDRVFAVIKGTAINNDGRRKAGFTAPSPLGQAEVIIAAHAAAGVSADSISYVEAHGTATPVGDPIEVQALTNAFAHSTTRTGYCALGSVKSNIGHTDVTAGIAGLIKTALALHHGTIPASINFTDPNPLLDLARSPFYVNAVTAPWPRRPGPRRAGVSSFGVGGTNAHAVLEEAPPPAPVRPAAPYSVIVVSARTATALRRAATDLAEHLTSHPELNLSDVAYTLQVGRRALPYRHAVAAATGQEVSAYLHRAAEMAPDPVDEAPVVFLFPGGGAHYDGMGRQLYRTEPVFRDAIDRCAAIVSSATGHDLRAVLYDRGAKPVHGDHTYHLDGAAGAAPPMTSAAIVATEYAMARWLLAHDVRPAAMLGHSLGEYTAAILAGVLDPDDALRVIVERERLSNSVGGVTYTVALGEHDLQPYLTDGLSVATVNGPTNCVVSGSAADIAALTRVLTRDGVRFHQLRIAFAAHSSLLDPVLGAFGAVLRNVPLGSPTIPYVSNVTGTWITAEQASDPEYWVRHTRRTVRFAEGLATASELAPVFVEVGPDGGLTKLVQRQLGPSAAAVPTMPHAYAGQPDQSVLFAALARLWRHGVPVKWSTLDTNRQRRRIPLPGYPFERRRYWIESPARSTKPPRATTPAAEQTPAASTPAPGAVLAPRPPLPQPYAAPTTPLERALVALWERTLGTAPIGVHDNFFDLGGESLVFLQLVAAVRDELGPALSGRGLFLARRLTVAGFAAEITERENPDPGAMVDDHDRNDR